MIILNRLILITKSQFRFDTNHSLKIQFKKYLALAVTSDGNINQLGDGDDRDLGVQNDTKIVNK